MKLFNDIKEILIKDKKLLLLTNAYYFGLVIAGAIIALIFPQAQLYMLDMAQTGLSSGPLSGVASAYISGNVLYAAAVTFVTNLFLGTIIEITLPSLIIPIWAPIMGLIRALMWGIMLIVPVPGVLPFKNLLPHYITILLEGEAYVVAIFACLRQVKVLLGLGSMPKEQRLKAYLKAIVDNVKLLAMVALILAVAALYEAWEVMFFAGILK
ncbi:hypothetical protein [Methanocella conradii]|uniref:hypothetical protein n=1 Tax=Methanocella conradii TaxID=1175444 RepID=UPI00157BB743|nr:hypothetical protein [Methanocella conradii]